MGKVLVTGVNGFVGHHLAKELSSNNLTVVGVGGTDKAAQKPNFIDGYLVLDLSRPDEVKKIDFTCVDGVVHLAGLAAVGPSFDQPMEYITTNMGIEVNLFEAALQQKASPRFLIVSTGALYDPSAKLPLTESSPVIPSSPYAVSKVGQETLAQYYGNRDFECIIARPFNHIGPGQGPGFIVPDIAQQVIACEKGELNTVKVGNLDAKRDYTDVRDIVRAYRLLLEKGQPGEIYNVCSGKSLGGQDVLDGLLSASHTQPEIQPDPSKMRPADNLEIYGSHQKLSQATGWQPEIPLEKTLADVITDWRSRK